MVKIIMKSERITEAGVASFTTRENPWGFEYKTLLAFIQRNKQLERNIARISSHRVELETMLAALNRGDFDDAIFKNNDCDLYLLSLFRDKKITPTVFLTAYMYLMALMEFTDSEIGAGLASRVTLETSPVVIPVLKDGVITAEAKHYFYNVTNREPSDVTVKSLAYLPDNEKVLIKLTFTNDEYNYKLGNPVLRDILKFTPFFYEKCLGKGLNTIGIIYYVPSFSLINYFIMKSRMEPQPMSPFPGFGAIGDETLLVLHRTDHHFLPLANRFVETRYKKVHDKETGVFQTLIHDIFHWQIASSMSKKLRHYVTHDLIDMLLRVHATCLEFNNIGLARCVYSYIFGDLSFNDLTTHGIPKLYYVSDAIEEHVNSKFNKEVGIRFLLELILNGYDDNGELEKIYTRIKNKAEAEQDERYPTKFPAYEAEEKLRVERDGLRKPNKTSLLVNSMFPDAALDRAVEPERKKITSKI